MIRTTPFLLALAGLVLLLASSPAFAAERARSNDCREALSDRGVEFERGPATRGVPDPITVDLPLRGIDYIYYGGSSPSESLFMDCSLAGALVSASKSLKRRGIVAIEHIGIYNYRCLEGAPPPCKLSQHAHAAAIDVHEFRREDGRRYNVEDHWAIDPKRQSTCEGRGGGGRSSLLHRLACEWSELDVFSRILTPNYDAAHRNHFHLDLTPGDAFIR